MEYQILFPAFIVTMAACHLIARAAKAMGDDRPTANQTRGQRGDWYVFFHCRDLTGEKEESLNRERRQQSAPLSKERAPRPVLRVG